MFADLAFVSSVELLDPTQHRVHDEWHQLDHGPVDLTPPVRRIAPRQDP